MEAISMLVRTRSRLCVAACLVSLGSSGCAAAVSDANAMAELDRLRAAVRQSEERMATMQTHQHQLSQQLATLSALVGAMEKEASVRREEIARNKENIVGSVTATVSIPAQPAQPALPPSELEF